MSSVIDSRPDIMWLSPSWVQHDNEPALRIEPNGRPSQCDVMRSYGDPVADLSSLDDEPWKVDRREGKGRGMQARVGDHAIFFRKAAVEISFEEKKYLVVPQAAILVLIRDDLPI